MVEIFIAGCTTCGTNAVYVARVKSRYPDATVYNTRYSGSEQRAQHLEYLKQAGLKASDYQAIVVENGGERITRLASWKSQE